MARAETLVTDAYQAWELKEFTTAAELFLNASIVESEEATERSKWAAPDSSVLYRLRAGFCLFEAGQTERALELVKEGINFDWKAARLWGDRRDAEKCHICYILHYANLGDKPRYSLHVELAMKDGERLDTPFPWCVPVKKKAITSALAMEDFDSLSTWVAAVDADARRKDPELGLLCSQSDKAVANKAVNRSGR
jgi:hypothetical protein